MHQNYAPRSGPVPSVRLGPDPGQRLGHLLAAWTPDAYPAGWQQAAVQADME